MKDIVTVLILVFVMAGIVLWSGAVAGKQADEKMEELMKKRQEEKSHEGDTKISCG